MESLVEALSAVTLKQSSYYFIAFDTEGTKRSGGIREIGAVAVDDDAQTFFDVVTQRGRTEGLAARDAARTWDSVAPRFAAWVRAVTPKGRLPVLVGHNVARHDIPLIRGEECAPGLWEGLSWVDTLPAVRAGLPALHKRDQSSVYKHLYGAEPAKHATHTALADARAAASIAAHPDIRPHLESARPQPVGLRKDT
jgi:hypothetical protein